MTPLPSSLTFTSPAFLWGLLLLPLAAAAYALAQRRRARYAVHFTNLDVLASVLPRTPPWRRHLPGALYLLALGALLLGLSRPQAMIPVAKDQATVVMVMDTSGSMAAADVQPDRISAAKAAGKSFLDVLPNTFRVSLVSFSSAVSTLVRPTADRTVVRAAIDSLHADGGTAMGDAIVRAVEVAQAPPLDAGAAPASRPSGAPAPAAPTATATPGAPAAETRPAAILLLSDGANTDGQVQPLEAARAARAAGIPVYTIALGTPDGTLDVSAGGAPGGRRGPSRRVNVPPDEATLRQVAEVTGGQYFAAPSARDLRAVYRDIGSRIGFEYESLEVTFAFAVAGVVLFLAGAGLALARRVHLP